MAFAIGQGCDLLPSQRGEPGRVQRLVNRSGDCWGSERGEYPQIAGWLAEPTRCERGGYVFENAKLLRKADLLKRARDAEARAAMHAHAVDAPAAEEDLTAVDHVDAGYAADQRRFSGAIWTDKSVDLAGKTGEIHALQGLHPSEVFRNTLDF